MKRLKTKDTPIEIKDYEPLPKSWSYKPRPVKCSICGASIVRRISAKEYSCFDCKKKRMRARAEVQSEKLRQRKKVI